MKKSILITLSISILILLFLFFTFKNKKNINKKEIEKIELQNKNLETKDITPSVVDNFIEEKEPSSSTNITASPTFSVKGGLYKTSQYIIITSATENASIKYTTDNSDPITSITAQIGTNITVDTSMTIKAYSFKRGLQNSSVAKATYVIENFPINVAKRDMIRIPSGAFTQSDGKKSFKHTISSFQIAKYEVTYELWRTVYTWAKNNGYVFSNPGREGHDGFAGKEATTSKYEPVTMISWRDAIVWCNAYSEMTGLSPCYAYEDRIIKDSRDANAKACDNTTCNWKANGYRLPTEGEWQYAAGYIDGKKWTPSTYASGAGSDYSDIEETKKVAWYDAGSTKNVGTTTISNKLGIFDMSGNVYEWCWDWFGEYPESPQTNYSGPLKGTVRVGKGGSYYNLAVIVQIGDRGKGYPYDWGTNYGFRVARSR